jgi:putative tryptophan/tyrosine transport system substrate-binding protein
MRRRALLQWATVILASPQLVTAQAPRRFRVGILYAPDEAAVKEPGGAFLAGLRELGYVPGKNLVVDVRHARGDNSRYSALAEELIALKPDVLVAIESVAVVIRSKTTTIPIVVIAGPDPVAAGLVHSASRPGTNVTGNAFRQDELIAKQIELLTEVVPSMSHVAFLNYATAGGDLASGFAVRYEGFARTAAAGKGLKLTVVAARDPASLQQAFAALEQAQPQGLVVAAAGFTYQFRQEIIYAARRLRLPSISAFPPGWVQAGALLNYGPDYIKLYRYAARFVDRIFRGANPAEMPIEYPALFELAVNLKAARELGIEIPRSIVLRADRVIE